MDEEIETEINIERLGQVNLPYNINFNTYYVDYLKLNKDFIPKILGSDYNLDLFKTQLGELNDKVDEMIGAFSGISNINMKMEFSDEEGGESEQVGESGQGGESGQDTNQILKNFRIHLFPIKEIEDVNKKIISTCVFFPNSFSFDCKTYNYLTGLIKSVEKFKERMNSSGEKWIYRIYYDMMIDQIAVLQKNVFKSHLSYYFRTKKINKQFLNTKIDDSFDYNLNIFVKLGNLYKDYLYHIAKYYDFVEIVAYDCPMVRYFPNLDDVDEDIGYLDKIKNINETQFQQKFRPYYGHDSTFGSILRFLPLFEENVERVFFVNSSHSISPFLQERLHLWQEKKYCCALPKFYDAEEEIFKHYKPIKNILKKNTKDIGGVIIPQYFIDLGINEDLLKKYLPFNKVNDLPEDADGKMPLVDLPIFEKIFRMFAGATGINVSKMDNKELIKNTFMEYIANSINFEYGVDELILTFIITPDIQLSKEVLLKRKDHTDPDNIMFQDYSNEGIKDTVYQLDTDDCEKITITEIFDYFHKKTGINRPSKSENLFQLIGEFLEITFCYHRLIPKDFKGAGTTCYEDVLINVCNSFDEDRPFFITGIPFEDKQFFIKVISYIALLDPQVESSRKSIMTIKEIKKIKVENLQNETNTKLHKAINLLKDRRLNLYIPIELFYLVCYVCAEEIQTQNKKPKPTNFFPKVNSILDKLFNLYNFQCIDTVTLQDIIKQYNPSFRDELFITKESVRIMNKSNKLLQRFKFSPYTKLPLLGSEEREKILKELKEKVIKIQ